MAGPFDGLSGYELRHLPLHLAKAGRAGDLHRLLQLEHEPDPRSRRLTGRSLNAWYAAATADGDTRRYLDHVQVALGEAERATREALTVASEHAPVALEFQYALAAASARNVSANASVRLLTAMIRRGLLSDDEALAHVRQIPDPRDRAEALTTLLPLATTVDAGDVAAEALAAVSAIPDEFWRVGELGRLMPALPAYLHSQAEIVAEGVRDPYYRAVALAVTGRTVDPALQAPVDAIHFHRKSIMATEWQLDEVAAPFRAEFSERGARAVDNLGAFVRDGSAGVISEPYWLTETYADLAEDGDEYFDAAVSLAGTVGGGGSLFRLAQGVVSVLGAGSHTRQVLDLVDDPSEHLLLRCQLATLAGDGSAVGVDEVAGVDDPYLRLDALCTLLPVLSVEDTKAALATVLGAGDEHLRADGLVRIAPALDAGDLDAALDAAGALGHDEQRMRARGALAARAAALGTHDPAALLAEVTEGFWYGRALDAVVPALVGGGRAEEALRLAASSPYPHRRAALAAAAARALPEPDRGLALATAEAAAAELAEPATRSRALTLVAAALAATERDCVLSGATAAALAIEQGHEPLRSAAVAGVAIALAGTDRAFELAQSVVDEHWLATTMSELARRADEDGLATVLAAARAMRSRRERGRTLAASARRQAELTPDRVVLHERWREALSTLALAGRAEFLDESVALVPVARALGGPDALVAMVRAGRTALRWWP